MLQDHALNQQEIDFLRAKNMDNITSISKENVVVLVTELNDSLYEYMSLLNVEGFVKIKTPYEAVAELSIYEFIGSNFYITGKGYSESSYEIRYGSKFIILTYFTRYGHDADNGSILINDCGDFSETNISDTSIKTIRNLCNDCRIDAARSHVKSARN